MNKAFSVLTLTALLGSVALAQATNRNGAGTRGVFPLPDGVDRAVALDHNNTIVTQARDDAGGTITAAIQPKHVYIGGIAQLFGIPVVPSSSFVSPGFGNGGFGNGLNQPGFNNGGFNNNGFNNGGFNNGGGNVAGGGFMFPSGNLMFGAGQPNTLNVQPFGQGGPQIGSQNNWGNWGNLPQGQTNQPVRPRGQAGIGLGTPRGNFFVPSQVTN